MSPSVNLPFTLSLVLLLLCLHLIKLIFILLCLVHLTIHHRHQLFKCIVVVNCLIVHQLTLFWCQHLIPPAPIVEPGHPIAIRKSIRSTRNPSPHYTALSYHRLSQPFYTCLSFISSVSIPKSRGDALAHPGWRQAIQGNECASE